MDSATGAPCDRFSDATVATDEPEDCDTDVSASRCLGCDLIDRETARRDDRLW